MGDRRESYEQQPLPQSTAPTSPATSPALSEESHTSTSSLSTPPSSYASHEALYKELTQSDNPSLPPLRPNGASGGSERPLRYLGVGLTFVEDERHSPDGEYRSPSPDLAEDQFGLGSEVSRGDKIKGKLTTLLGRITNDSGKILEGQVRANGAHLALRSEERSAIE